MKKITKIILASFASIAVSVSAFAGELTLTGSVKASYSIGGADQNGNKGFGITNELAVGATGELDNGFTWKYNLDLDPTAGGSIDQDDSSLTLTTPFGTTGVFISEGGLSTETGFGIGANGVGQDYATPMTWVKGDDVDGYSNVQYHTPAGLLPFGIGAKIAYVPNLSTTNDSLDFKDPGSVETGAKGTSATMYQISASPIAGLNVGADYFETDGGTDKQTPTNGNVYANYTYGPIKVGYYKGYVDASIAADKTVSTGSNHDKKGYGVQFAVNDQLSVSYSREDLTQRVRAAIADGAASAVKTETTAEITSIQAAYNIGGATLGIAQQEVDNSEFTAGLTETVTLVTIAMAF